MIIFLVFINFIFSFNSDPTSKSDDTNYFLNNNPAIKNKSIVFGFSPNNFGVSELDKIYLSLNYNKNSYSFNMGVNADNNILNQELDFNLGAIYKYNDIFQIGARIHYVNSSIKDYSSIDNFYLDIGAIFNFDSLSIGSYFNNVYLIDNQNYQYFRAAVSYSENQFSFYFGPEIIINKYYGLNSGIKYRIIGNVNLRISYSSIYQTFSASLSLIYNKYIINLSLSKHNSLGYSQDYQIIYDY